MQLVALKWPSIHALLPAVLLCLGTKMRKACCLLELRLVRRVWSGGFSLGIRSVFPIWSPRQEFSASNFGQIGQQVVALAPNVQALMYLQAPLPFAYMIEATLPLFSPGAFNIRASLGLGAAHWGELPAFALVIPESEGASFELRFHKWALAYSGIIDLDWNLGESWLIRASAGYMGLGKLSSQVVTLSAGGITFGLGIGLKL